MSQRDSDLIRGCGLYARDIFELFGFSDPIPMDDASTVQWDPGNKCAVFNGIAAGSLIVSEASLDDHPYVLTPAALGETGGSNVATQY